MINARETAPRVLHHNLLSGCGAGFPIGKDTGLCPPGVHRAQGGELSYSLAWSGILFSLTPSTWIAFWKSNKKTRSINIKIPVW